MLNWKRDCTSEIDCLTSDPKIFVPVGQQRGWSWRGRAGVHPCTNLLRVDLWILNRIFFSLFPKWNIDPSLHIPSFPTKSCKAFLTCTMLPPLTSWLSPRMFRRTRLVFFKVAFFSFFFFSVDFVKWSSQGMLRMSPDAMNALFKPTIDQIIEHLSRY